MIGAFRIITEVYATEGLLCNELTSLIVHFSAASIIVLLKIIDFEILRPTIVVVYRSVESNDNNREIIF